MPRRSTGSSRRRTRTSRRAWKTVSSELALECQDVWDSLFIDRGAKFLVEGLGCEVAMPDLPGQFGSMVAAGPGFHLRHQSCAYSFAAGSAVDRYVADVDTRMGAVKLVR